MAISKDQVSDLLKRISTNKPDDYDCDGCFNHMAEFVEAELVCREIPDALRAVQIHLEQCACCKDEHDALLEGLRNLEQE